MIYLTYEDYKEMGGEMEKQQFTRFSLMATNIINRITRNRVYNDLINNVIIKYEINLKALMFELIEVSKSKISIVDSGEVTSESNQGMSKSFKQVKMEDVEKAAYDLCEIYLANYQDKHGTPLMYLGIR